MEHRPALWKALLGRTCELFTSSATAGHSIATQGPILGHFGPSGLPSSVPLKIRKV